MEIKQYYFAVYSKALLEENRRGDVAERGATILDNTVFYEKRFYLAHIKESTYENSDPEELSFLAKDDSLNSNLIPNLKIIFNKELCDQDLDSDKISTLKIFPNPNIFFLVN